MVLGSDKTDVHRSKWQNHTMCNIYLYNLVESIPSILPSAFVVSNGNERNVCHILFKNETSIGNFLKIIFFWLKYQLTIFLNSFQWTVIRGLYF